MVKSKIPDEYVCPLNNKTISKWDCLENRDVVNGLIKDDRLPKEFKIDNFREICKNCKYFNY